jgi:hypothetical protein
VAREREAEWKTKERMWEIALTNSDSGWDVPVDDPRRGDWSAPDTKLFSTVHALSHGWPSVEGGVEVSIEVHSNAGEIAEERTTCR